MHLFIWVFRSIIQLYNNLEEIKLLRELGLSVKRGITPKGCIEKVRIRYPFSVTYPEYISIGEKTEFMQGARLNIYPEEGDQIPKIAIGRHCYFGRRVSIFAEANVSIGDDVLGADDVTIDAGNHGINPELSTPYMDQKLVRKTVHIGNNVWLGEKSMICAGVSIGNGCVIGAGAVVTHDIPDHSIVGGVPAKVIKQFDFKTHEWKTV